MTFIHPQYYAAAFNCPHCNAYAHQTWEYALHTPGYGNSYTLPDFMVATCAHCKKYSFWYHEKMIYPDIIAVPLPNADLPDDIKIDYLEAREIVNKSPRGATALLRLCIQKLCISLGEETNINNAIGNLVKKGLSIKIQQALDVVRVVGNEAVHPGELDLKDDYNTAIKLFDLVNFITNELITKPKELDKLYKDLPQSKLDAIDNRDKK